MQFAGLLKSPALDFTLASTLAPLFTYGSQTFSIVPGLLFLTLIPWILLPIVNAVILRVTNNRAGYGYGHGYSVETDLGYDGYGLETDSGYDGSWDSDSGYDGFWDHDTAVSGSRHLLHNSLTFLLQASRDEVTTTLSKTKRKYSD